MPSALVVVRSRVWALGTFGAGSTSAGVTFTEGSGDVVAVEISLSHQGHALSSAGWAQSGVG